jgi:hypothetical protein
MEQSISPLSPVGYGVESPSSGIFSYSSSHSLLSSPCVRSPLILIHNLCGTKLSVSLCLNKRLHSPRSSGGSSPRVELSSIDIPPHRNAKINTPWHAISSTYGDHVFPMLLFSVTLTTDDGHQDFLRLYFLHSLSTEKIFIPLCNCPSSSRSITPSSFSRFIILLV